MEFVSLVSFCFFSLLAHVFSLKIPFIPPLLIFDALYITMLGFHAIGFYLLQIDWHTVVLSRRTFCTFFALFHRYLCLFTFLAPGAPPIVYANSSTVAVLAFAPHTKVLAEAYTTTMFAFVATFSMDTECVLVVHDMVLADHFGSGIWFSC